MYAQDWDEYTPGGAYTRFFVWERIGRGCCQGDCTKRTDWHGGGINMVFADSHAGWVPLGGIFYRHWKRDLPEWDPHWNKPITQDW